MQIVTYAYAYLSHQTIDLCDRHADHPPDFVAPLGQVQHGAREGSCQACLRLGEVEEEVET